MKGVPIIGVDLAERKRPPTTHGFTACLVAGVPRHELGDLALHVVVEDLSEGDGDVGLGVHAIRVAHADQ